MAISAAGTLRGLAHRILQAFRQDAAADAAPISDAESALLAMHGGNADGARGDNAFTESKLNTGSNH
jgi:hypothetical protein